MTSYIQSIQPFSITIASGSTSNTATISAVTTNNAIIIFDGCEGNNAANASRSLGYCTLTNSTTVTATRNSGTSSTCTVKGTVVEFTGAAVNVAAQYGTVTLASVASNTATITSVDITKAVIIYLGMSTSNGGLSTSVWTNVELTNSTTVTATRTGTTGTNVVSFCVLEFTTTVMKTVQQRSITLTDAGTAPTDTITSVTTGNTLLFYGGASIGNAGPNNSMHYLSLTNGTTVTLTRSGTNTSTRIIKYCVLEFQVGVLNSNVQRGTISLASVASNTATISAVNTSNSVVNCCNYDSTSASTVAIDELVTDCTLTNSTTVTANKNTAGSSTLVFSYEVAEFTANAGTFNPGWVTGATKTIGSVF